LAAVKGRKKKSSTSPARRRKYTATIKVVIIFLGKEGRMQTGILTFLPNNMNVLAGRRGKKKKKTDF